jgi:hypothetical protein
MTQARGIPDFVQYERNFGACPRIESPNKIRDPAYKRLLPAENALVRIAAFTIDCEEFQK